MYPYFPDTSHKVWGNGGMKMAGESPGTREKLVPMSLGSPHIPERMAWDLWWTEGHVHERHTEVTRLTKGTVEPSPYT
jgi:hypothetical protein